MLPSIEKPFGWRSEFDRLERWWQRIAVAKRNETDIQEEVDFYLSFFQSAYILQEWIKTQLPKMHSSLLPNLKYHGVIRDIAVRHRHLTIHRPSDDADFVICREYEPWDEVARLVLLSNGTKYALHDVASATYRFWRNAVDQVLTERPRLIAAGGR